MGEYLVNAYQPGFFLYCRPKKKPFTHRFPSTATPSFLTAPHNGMLVLANDAFFHWQHFG